jgi:hypothetical protein
MYGWNAYVETNKLCKYLENKLLYWTDLFRLQSVGQKIVSELILYNVTKLLFREHLTLLYSEH